ncbi:hypothetical protein DFJ74DRAFT_764338, partial [Hyaloraphidium curvatum]
GWRRADSQRHSCLTHLNKSPVSRPKRVAPYLHRQLECLRNPSQLKLRRLRPRRRRRKNNRRTSWTCRATSGASIRGAWPAAPWATIQWHTRTCRSA